MYRVNYLSKDSTKYCVSTKMSKQSGSYIENVLNLYIYMTICMQDTISLYMINTK